MQVTKISWILILCCCLSLPVVSQNTNSSLLGTVRDLNGNTISGAVVIVKGTSEATVTNLDGEYKIVGNFNGTYLVEASHLGYKNFSKKIIFRNGGSRQLNIVLTEATENLGEVVVSAKSRLQQIEALAFNVDVLDAEKLHNTTLDISQALNRISGVKVRRSGGVGSRTNISLNGFTGRHVKYFIDGVPMEGFNSAFQLNNIPINLAKRIEVYKGVVPLEFGSDALGGAINIVTENGKQNFLNASYSYGSFNTHKSFLNAAYTSNSGFTARLTAFQNYSDNNYKVDAEIVDLENFQFTGDVREVRRFHDMYRNYTLMGKVGFINKAFADQLLLGFTYGDEYDQIQHPAYMKIAFGDVYMTSETLMPSLTYRKKDLFTNNLNVSLSANYNFGESANIDDSYRRYNWLGEYVETDAPGEFQYSRRFFKDRNGTVNSNITYTIGEEHTFTLNNVLNTFSRKNRNEVEPSPADDYPSETIKDILGVGYKFQPIEDLNTSFFYKYYYNKVNQYADPNSSGNYENMERVTEDHGYGLAASYFIFDNLQLKTSYEKAYRLPSGRELFGVGNNFQLGNPDLKSESSDNFNIGFNYNWPITKQHHLNIDGSFIYRDIKDFIRQVPNPSDGVLRPGNEASVKNRGVDMQLQYSYGNLLSVGTSFTYQNLRNKLKYTSGKDVVSTIYNDRIPNMPYLYGNGNISFYFRDLWQGDDRLNLSYNLLYVHEFDYSYESYGGRKIPEQLSHDLFLNYSFNGGKYSISLECRNILDENLYDNFSLQKPGRSFAIKLGYFLDNIN